LDAPSRIGVVAVTIDPGPQFAFGETRVAPLAPGTVLPDSFRPGEPARAGAVESAVGVAVLDWREAGHAKVTTDREEVVADHRTSRLSADIRLAPGPALRFGPATVTGAERMRVQRILKIAGLRSGEAFSQSELDRAAARLRRTGVFSSVTLQEGETLLDGGLLPIEISVVEQKPRRYSVGAEIASLDGLSLTGSWLHRNLLGGGERFQVSGEITNIGSGVSGVDYRLGITIDRPATLSPDTTGSLSAEVGRLDEIDYRADFASFGLSFRHYFSENLTAEAGIAYEYAEGQDPGGPFRFRSLALPLSVTWDRRDNRTDARTGFYLAGTAKPFQGFGTTGSGVKLTLDGRGYRSFGEGERLTLAARVQAGAVLGPDLLETPRDDLFFSGGGGTVRGQPYRSLGIPILRGSGPQFQIGGAYMMAASVEARVRLGGRLGVVAFADAGAIGAEDFFDPIGDWHAGAGLGLRYETGFGPVRLDVAAPVAGRTGDGVQLYIGLGQSF
jgi:translocation and assembly module TamA